MSVIDVDIYGREKLDGSPVTYEDDDAISNSLVYFLTSQKGDYISDPDRGGILYYLLYKSMMTDIESLEFLIENEINDNFSHVIDLEQVLVTPLYEEREWEIKINYTSLLTNKNKSLTVYLDSSPNNWTETEEVEYMDIDYEGENLFNFILLTQPALPNEKILFNDEFLCWTWGHYKLIKLNDSDDYFSSILALLNI